MDIVSWVSFLKPRKENNRDFIKSNLRFLIHIVVQYYMALDLKSKFEEAFRVT